MSKRGKHRRAETLRPSPQRNKTGHTTAACICVALIGSLLLSVPSNYYYELTIGGGTLFLISLGSGLALGLLSCIWLKPGVIHCIGLCLSMGLFATSAACFVNWHYADEKVEKQDFVIYKKSISSTRYPSYWLHVRRSSADARLTVGRRAYTQDTLNQLKTLHIRHGGLSYPVIVALE